MKNKKLNIAQQKDAKRNKTAFENPNFKRYWIARVLTVGGNEMVNATALWQMWQITRDPFDLGLVGLAQFAPFLILFLISGLIADRFSRKAILSICMLTMACAAMGLFLVTYINMVSKPYLLLILVFVGIARAFQAPAQHALVPVIVEKDQLSSAIAWSSLGSQMARISGPALMSALLYFGIDAVYGVTVFIFVIGAAFNQSINKPMQLISSEPVTLSLIVAGIRFIIKRKIILGAIGLDLFAVLLGGATALLPIFATDILFVDEWGYGSLRMTIMLGSFICMYYLTQFPITKFGGNILLLTVAGFGLSIIIFGLSTNYFLSLFALFFMGASDSISVFIRNILVQSITPDNMRGRVTAVSSVFIGASNELGEFESGITASWWGAVPAVIVGGIGTVAISILFAKLFPDLRKVDSLRTQDLIDRYQ